MSLFPSRFKLMDLLLWQLQDELRRTKWSKIKWNRQQSNPANWVNDVRWTDPWSVDETEYLLNICSNYTRSSCSEIITVAFFCSEHSNLCMSWSLAWNECDADVNKYVIHIAAFKVNVNRAFSSSESMDSELDSFQLPKMSAHVHI